MCKRAVTPPASSRPSGTTFSPKLKYIYKYLVQYIPAPKKVAAPRRVSGFRVLTSATSLAYLEEKAEEKKKAAEEKQKRKEAKVEKSIAEAKHQKEAEKAEKAKEREQQRQARATKSKQPPNRGKEKGTKKSRTEDPVDNVRGTEQSQPSDSPKGKRTKRPRTADPVNGGGEKGKKASTEPPQIDMNGCSICFCMYNDDVCEGTGVEWLCGRWVHEECIDYEIVIEASGSEQICPYCALFTRLLWSLFVCSCCSHERKKLCNILWQMC